MGNAKTTVEALRLIGSGVDRVDGPLKITGSAPYSSDFSYPEMAHAALVHATVAAGWIRGIDAVAAEASPGVLAVITHSNAPAAPPGPRYQVLASAAAAAVDGQHALRPVR